MSTNGVYEVARRGAIVVLTANARAVAIAAAIVALTGGVTHFVNWVFGGEVSNVAAYLIATLTTLILGCTLGYRAQPLGNGLPWKNVLVEGFGVAWRVAGIWVLVLGFAEYGMTLLVSQPTAASTVHSYPAVLVAVTLAVLSSFTIGYVASVIKTDVAKMSPRDILVTVAALVPVLLAGIGFFRTLNASVPDMRSELAPIQELRLQCLFQAFTGVGEPESANRDWPRPVVARTVTSAGIQVVLWPIDGPKPSGTGYDLQLYVRKDPSLHESAAQLYSHSADSISPAMRIHTFSVGVEQFVEGATIDAVVTPRGGKTTGQKMISDQYRLVNCRGGWKAVRVLRRN